MAINMQDEIIRVLISEIPLHNKSPRTKIQLKPIGFSMGSNWSQLVSIGLNWSEQVSIGPNAIPLNVQLRPANGTNWSSKT